MSLIGGADDDALTGSSADETFNLTGAGEGTLTRGGVVINFSEMEDLDGAGGSNTLNITGAGSTTGTISNFGTISLPPVTGTAGNDIIQVRLNAGTGAIEVQNGAATSSFFVPGAGTTVTLTVNGGLGADQLVIDNSVGGLVPINIVYDGQAGGDSVQIISSGTHTGNL